MYSSHISASRRSVRAIKFGKLEPDQTAGSSRRSLLDLSAFVHSRSRKADSANPLIIRPLQLFARNHSLDKRANKKLLERLESQREEGLSAFD